MSAPAAVRHVFTRAMRLRHRGEFERLRKTGQRLAKGSLALNWVVLPAGHISRLGVITPRKLGAANKRSRARRLLRENFRLHQHDLRQPVEMVLIARASILDKTFSDVERDFLSLLRQARLLT